jgi:pyruvate formate lyase activating enzyme
VSAVDPIEKKPIFHYRPGTKVLSMGTFGCNLRCMYCQNAVLVASSGDLSSVTTGPQEVIDLVVERDAQGIAWTFNEPIVWAEFVIETAELARAQGLYTIINTNGFVSQETGVELLGHVDVANIDIKGFSESFYHAYCGGELKNALRTSALAQGLGVHVELTNLLVPALNDSADEIEAFSQWAVRTLGADTPIFFFWFRPSHQLSHLPEQHMEKLK